MKNLRSRDAFALLIGVAFVISIVADIVVPDYEIPAGFIALIGGIVTAWFGLGLAGRNGQNSKGGTPHGGDCHA